MMPANADILGRAQHWKRLSPRVSGHKTTAARHKRQLMTALASGGPSGRGPTLTREDHGQQPSRLGGNETGEGRQPVHFWLALNLVAARPMAASSLILM